MPRPIIDNEFDRGEIAALINSRGWALFVQIVRADIAEHVETLVSQEDPELRGRIKGMRDVINTMPKSILDQAKAAIEKRGDQ